MNGYAAPSRTDWRWATISELNNVNDTKARSIIAAYHDDTCRRAYEFKRMRDPKISVSVKYPDIAAAYDIYMGENLRRGLLEGYLLTGADDDRIAASFGCHPKTITSYHDIFFDVRPRLSAHAWITSSVFKDLPYTGVHKGDRQGMIHRIAWIGGLSAFEASISPRASVSDVFSIYQDVIERALAQNSVEIVLSGAGSPEVSSQFLATTMEKIKSNSERKGGGSSDYEEAVTAFVRGVGITVADPTISANLKLPARELREAEYEVTP